MAIVKHTHKRNAKQDELDLTSAAPDWAALEAELASVPLDDALLAEALQSDNLVRCVCTWRLVVVFERSLVF